ncbi:MAG: hypothetical protein ACQUHE_05450 [Bacteroidia bacterium]
MLVFYIVPISILIPILFGLINYKGADKGARLLLFYLITSGLINLAAITIFRRNNLPLLHLYTIVEAVLILSYLRSLFVESTIKRIIRYITIIFPILCVINFTFLQSINTFNTHTRPLEAILITSFCLLYLYKSGMTENWINKSSSWFNMGILVYFPVACIIFIVSNYMVFVQKNRLMNHHVWDLHAVLVLLMYIIWARGFYLLKNGR